MKSASLAPLADSYWLYRWCERVKDEKFGPFDNITMQAWQHRNMFTTHPAEACRCNADGSLLEEIWRPADQIDFCPANKHGLGKVWAANKPGMKSAKKRRL